MSTLLQHLARIAPVLKEAPLRALLALYAEAETAEPGALISASSRKLAARTGLARSNAQRALDQLAEAGVIEAVSPGTRTGAASFRLPQVPAVQGGPATGPPPADAGPTVRPPVAAEQSQGGPTVRPPVAAEDSQGGPASRPQENSAAGVALNNSPASARVSVSEIDRQTDRSIDRPALSQAETDSVRNAIELFRLASGPTVQATPPIIAAVARVSRAYGRTIYHTLAALERVRRRVNGKRDLWPVEPLPWFRAVLTTEFEREDAERAPAADPPLAAAAPKQPPAIETETAASREAAGELLSYAVRGVKSL